MNDFLESAKALLAKEGEASLGTLEGEAPFVSAANYLFEPGPGEKLGNFYLFLSHLARHTKNIQKNRRASFLVVETRPEISLPERKRVTILGMVEEVALEEERKSLGEKYRKRFPGAEILLSLPDFRFYRLRPREIHWIAGFGQIRTLELPS